MQIRVLLFKKDHFAFTLAEVLIVLAIIGVVAALTIPALMQSTQDAELKTAWKKSYSDLNQAFSALDNDNGGSIKNVFTNSEDLKNALVGNLKTVKVCSGTPTQGGTGAGATAEGCWDNKPYYKNNIIFDVSGNSGFVTSNGVLVVLWLDKSDCTQAMGTITRCGALYVDVNGFKAPNIVGKDIFGIHILENRILPLGLKDYGSWQNDSTCDSNGLGCAARYLSQ